MRMIENIFFFIAIQTYFSHKKKLCYVILTVLANCLIENNLVNSMTVLMKQILHALILTKCYTSDEKIFHISQFLIRKNLLYFKFMKISEKIL